MPDPVTTISAYGARAREASRALAGATAAAKSAALEAMAAAVDGARAALLEANAHDMEQAAAEGVSGALADRQLLTDERIDGIVGGLRKVAALPDPVGAETGGWRLPNGIRLQRMRVPLGVVAVIYEARPNVTADAAGLCVKSGNAALLRGSSYTLRSNLAVGAALRAGLEEAGLPADAVQVIEDVTREGATALLTATEWVDLLVPRGGPGLIRAVAEDATVPVVIDGAGNCHVYVDAAADLDDAEAITINAKVQRPGVCNAAEKLLVDRSVADEFLPRIAAALAGHGVEVRGDDAARAIVPGLAPVADEEWDREYLDLVMAVKVVDGVGGAIEHIRRHGTGHTEAIVTNDYAAAQRFVAGVDAAATMVNASTRFTDGEEFGFGAEIGISTQKLHVRGPMGLEALTTERYVLWGDGHVR
ncbi:MAG: glutamate-5-semialdehyde dehydrogenase [Actinobacteria bacterium]|nr:glutamate-5-semialdehyde dehydrogenase [Actinomycetota bacterium]